MTDQLQPTDTTIVDGFTPQAMEQLDLHLEQAAGGGNRLVWFVYGFVAALLAGIVAGVMFLAISDEDDDGNLDVDIPAVDVELDG